MDDIEKSRIEYVARLEQQVAELHRQLMEVQPLAEKWTPIVAGEVAQDGTVRVTLGFGGKRTTATIGISTFANNTVQDLTHSIANTLAESMLVEKIAEVLRPEVERLLQGAKAVQGAGKW